MAYISYVGCQTGFGLRPFSVAVERQQATAFENGRSQKPAGYQHTISMSSLRGMTAASTDYFLFFSVFFCSNIVRTIKRKHWISGIS
ncbi:hypothetical protein O3M35_006299 [Rhynocoris fuscipes]|uniref:Uncharacterized protein n=1 Tax=Rhynocoris fuscipes TaxID=488301 RepID=A0AAW1DFC6_9HEMI